jgi:pimeloyl-ACP methyl ester carboxylesterase
LASSQTNLYRVGVSSLTIRPAGQDDLDFLWDFLAIAAYEPDERAHLAHRMVDLETHIQDVRAVLEYEDWQDVILVGHSYGGMVATGVADRLPDLVRHLVYLDAFVPSDGQSLNDLTGSQEASPIDGWLAPPRPMAPDISPEDLAWATPRRRHQSALCFSQRLQLAHPIPPFPRSYIHCAKKSGPDPFKQFADRYRDDPTWSFHALDAGHNPNITAPDALGALLLSKS